MDKKLSDNEIVKALDNDCLCVVYGVDCESCPLREKDCKILPEAIKDLIHRLQSENKELRTESDKMVAEHLAFVELSKKADEQQKAEIERLTEAKEDLYFQNQNLQTYIDNHEPIWKRNPEQAVKDTAREILQGFNKWLKQAISDSYEIAVLNSGGFHGGRNRAFHEVKDLVKKVAESKGVEVE